jgi:ketosteroid isomerase-like protein
MGKQDLEVMRRCFDAWNHGDLDALADTFGMDAQVVTDPSWMEAGPFEGRVAIRNWFAGLKDSWGECDTVVITEMFEAGDSVVARIDWRVRGRASGIDTALDATCVNAIERDRIIRQHWYFDHGKALEAVGRRGTAH